MRIVIMFDEATLGGHVLSALTTAKELQKRRGHEITLVGGPGLYAEEIKKDFDFVCIPFVYKYCGRESYLAPGFSKSLDALFEAISGLSVEMIHAFDVRSYILATLLDLFKFSVPVTCTICGGVAPYANIPELGKIIVFSDEQKKKMLKVYKWKEENVVVVPARMDMNQFEISDSEVSSLCYEYGIDPEGKNIMMISTFLGPKVKSIRNVLGAMRVLLARYPDYSFVMIGGKGDFFEDAKAIGEEINRDIGRKAIMFTGLVVGAFRLLKTAHIVLGLGRSAFEGMAFEKPTLIVGNKGYAGTVSEVNIDEIAYYNFSGRNNSEIVPKEVLIAEIGRLIEDSRYYDDVCSYGRRFLHKNIAIRSGIEKIEAVYQSNTQFSISSSHTRRLVNLLKVLTPIYVDNFYHRIKVACMGN